ncbi:MAG TPA: DUF523 domain-containing protein [Syntrophomonadaceae bacterium]|nr:DUF523 domain-containing protein [Syntrophomonadaceae bacterium]
MILVSACLTGENCKYNGGNNLHPVFQKMAANQRALLVCPEQLGGLPTPRTPCEILGGDGKAVLQGKAKVVNTAGGDLTTAFIKGAQKSLDIAQKNNIKLAVLKSHSPSCGCGTIYNGHFNSTLQPGDGVTTALLRQHQIKVLSEEEYLQKINKGEIPFIESD